MKKIIKGKLYSARADQQKLTALVKLSILLLICSLTTISAGSPDWGIGKFPDNKPDTGIYSLIQQDVVIGIVKDAATGEALAGVSVVLKGTTLGTLTDYNGRFSLRIPEKQGILIFSFIGYTIQEITVKQGSTVNISMELEIQEISEVVVVGYSTQKKESVVGAITQVNNEALIRSAAPNITNAITGKLSGVLTIQQTGEPGKNQAEIVIRGLSSWSGSAPLVLIDGVERDFQDMDPNEISTISVLKDASATAVFGSKGANGVIIVTTKRGYLGRPQMTFTGSTGRMIPTRLPSYIDSYTTMSMLNVAKMNAQQFSSLTSKTDLNEYRNPSTPLKALQFPSVDWFDVNAKDFGAPTANANISVAGGTNFVKYFVTLGYLYEGNFFKQAEDMEVDSRYWFNRFNYRANTDFNLTKTTQLSLNVGGETGIKNSPTVSYYGDWKGFYGTTGAMFPVYWPEWVLEEVPDIDYPEAKGVRRAASYSDWFTNPYNDLNSGNFERFMTSKLFTDLILDQKLDFILKGLSVKGKVALNTYYNMKTLYSSYTIPTYMILWSRVGIDEDGDGISDQNPWQRYGGSGLDYYHPAPLDINVGGMQLSTAGLGGADPGAAFHTDLYYEMSLNFARTLGKHDVTGLALMNRQQKNKGTAFPYYNAAYVGRVTYDYSNKYLLEINMGYTGSEQFAPGNRFGFFPSAAIGWVVSEENFFKNAVPWMNRLKLRYSDGLVGSDYADNRWLYVSDYFVDQRGYITEDSGANASAQWEEARKKDLGIEMGFFKNMLTLSIDLFDEQRSKMLLTPRSVTFIIGNSFKDLNLGSLKKHGIEIEAEFNRTTAYNLNYFIRGNLGLNENRIIFRDDPVYAPEYTTYAGKPLGAQMSGILVPGYHNSVDNIHYYPSPLAVQSLFVGDYRFIDYNVDGVINSQDVYPVKGQTYAPLTYSFTGGINYKGFDLSLMFQGSNGNYINLGSNTVVEFYKGDWRVHTPSLDYWRPDNQDATHSTLHNETPDNGGAIYTWGSHIFVDHHWRNSSYIRLKEIYLGYNLSSEFLKRSVGISNLLIYANGTNIFTITRLIKEFDPEIKSFGGGWYPQLSRYNLGVKFAF